MTDTPEFEPDAPVKPLSVPTAPMSQPTFAPDATVKPLKKTDAETPVDYGKMPWSDVAGSAVGNLIPSAKKFGEDLVQPILHPIDTAQSLGRVALGAAEKLVPGGEHPHEKYANAVGQYLVDRYGSEAGWKKAIAEDPVGVMSDVSMAVTGGGSAAARIPGTVGKVGRAVSEVGRAVDPLMAPVNAAKGVKGLAANLGTHTGSEVLNQAYQTGVRGGEAGEAFRDNMRGNVPISDVVDTARSGVANMALERKKQYVSDMAKLGQDQTILSWDDVTKALQENEKVKTFHGVNISPETSEIRNKIRDAVEQWGELPPEIYHTPVGFDALKQMIGDIKEATPYGTPQRKVANDAYNAIRKEIVKQAPEYAKTMKDYERASDLIKEMNQTLSLNPKANIDTTLRKLQSIMRNNVNTNYGRRLELGQLLEQNGAKNLMASLAGQASSSWFPRGLGKLGAEIGLLAAGSHFASPWTLAATPFMSPRFMGEAAHLTGRVVGKPLQKTNEVLGKVGLSNRKVGNTLYRAGRLVDEPPLTKLTVGANPDYVPGRATGGAVHAHVKEQAERVDTKPTEPQKEVGNYRKGHVRVHGLPISIENPRGSYREGKDANGKPWRSKLPAHYGYLKRTEGADGDHVDIYVGPKLKSPLVYVIDQHDHRTGKFDEHKAFIGFENAKDVKRTYHESFTDGRAKDRLRHMTEMTVGQFKHWLQNGDTTKPLKKKQRAEGGRVGFEEGGAPDWQDQEAQSNLAAIQSAQPRSWGDVMSDVAQAPVRVAKRLYSDATTPHDFSKVIPRLAGTQEGEDRFQTWPEQLVRSGSTLAGDTMSGAVPQWQEDPATGEMHTSPQMIERGQDLAGMAGGASAAQSLGKAGAENVGRNVRVLGKQILASDTGQGAPLSALEKSINIHPVEEHAPKFYSKLEQTVAELPNKATGSQILNTLKNKGIKAEELEHTGTQEFLEQNADRPLTKDEVAQHVAANKVQLGEVTKEAQKAWEDLSSSEMDKWVDRYREYDERDPRRGRIDMDAVAEFYERNRDESSSEAKFSGYQLPGGENYREKLLTLPKKEAALVSDAEALAGAKRFLAQLGEDWDKVPERSQLNFVEGARTQLQNERRASGEDGANYRSSHWDEPNVLVHRRTNEREVNGKPSLHIEEIQSDWHQQGRQRGYATEQPEVLRKQITDATEQMDQARKAIANTSPNLPDKRAARIADYERLKSDIQSMRDRLEASKKGIPNAPFKKNWHELALKDAIREAAEKGIDRISWTPGEAQAARYDLSKQVDQIRAIKRGDGNYTLAYVPKGERYVGENSFRPMADDALPASKLADYVGKDMADKIINDPETAKIGGAKYSGLDLKVGGSGMKGFYDKMIPDALNKIGKPHGVKVERGQTEVGRMAKDVDIAPVPGGWRAVVRGDNTGAHLDGPVHATSGEAIQWLRNKGHLSAPVHYMDIPPSLKEQALKKGFSLFEDSSVGAPIAALEHAPREGFGKLGSDPKEQALTVNDILHPDTKALPPRSRNVEDIAQGLMDRGAKALRKLGVKGGRIEEPSPRTDELLSRSIASEIKAAMNRGGKTASDWYTKAIDEAMDHAASIHPELKNDPHQKMGFTSALAITSQGEAVTSNVRLAEKAYDTFKKTGRFPTDVQAKNGPAMNANFKKMNALLDGLGPEGTREFLHKEFTVKELEQLGFDVGGENKQTKVYGSAILGPKIGQGFYQNLNGNYKPVTMDLWFMRAWGRLTGTLVGKTDMAKPTARLQDAIRSEGMRVPRDPEKLSQLADQIVLKHERDFRANRENYNSGEKSKSELTYAAERYVKNLKGINEQPTSGSQRVWMRDRVERARKILEGEGHKITNADLQAIWWYPEKELYSKLGGRDSEPINTDYASAFRDLAQKRNGAGDGAVRPVEPRSGSAGQADDRRAAQGSGARSKKANGQEVRKTGGRVALQTAYEIRRAAR